MKELDKISLYATVIVIKNRLMEKVKMNKNSKHSKIWSLGALYNIVMTINQNIKFGLLYWKERDNMYCLTNRTETNESGS